MPFGVLGARSRTRLLIGRDLERIFDYRRERARAAARPLAASSRRVRGARLPWNPMPPFRFTGYFEPTGDQPGAIEELSDGLRSGERFQTLLGATGTGKTFTMANVIAAVEQPTLVIAHNKTLAAQLCNEFREFFPTTRSSTSSRTTTTTSPRRTCRPRTRTSRRTPRVNEDIDRLRHAATSSLLRRRDVVIVASVSCIYGLGSPSEYEEQLVTVRVGRELLARQAPARARRHPVPPQRHGARPRPLPRARRRRRGAAGVLRDGVPRSRCSATRSSRSRTSTRSPARSTRARTRSRSTRRRTT